MDWCCRFYNHTRRHSSAGMKAPNHLRDHHPQTETRHREPSTLRGEAHPIDQLFLSGPLGPDPASIDFDFGHEAEIAVGAK
jgi:hypothetical protein